MQDVATGAVIASAASRPASLAVSTRVLPLSVSKVFLAAAWWDNHPAQTAVNINDLLATGSDSDGKQLAIELRHSAGTRKVTSDLRRYGLKSARLDSLNDADWAAALSIGETHMLTTPLEVSQFLQAVGNGGAHCAPATRRTSSNLSCKSPMRIIDESTTRQLAAGMLDCVKRGTAKRIANALRDGWTMGGKTGTGGRSGAPMEQQDGWFAGL